jgi:hypothetical protein
MNIDLLSLSAFALESSRGADRFVAEAHTLTLRLTRPAIDCSETPAMNGSASIEELLPGPDGLLRAAVLPASAPGLTITF